MDNTINEIRFNECIKSYKNLKETVLQGLRKIYLFTTPRYGESQSLKEIIKNTELNIDSIYEYLGKFNKFYDKKEDIMFWTLGLPSDSFTLNQLENDLKEYSFYADKIKDDFFFKYTLPDNTQKLIFDIYNISRLLILTRRPFLGDKNNDPIEVKKYITNRNEQKPILSSIKDFFSKLDELNEKLRSAYPQSVITDLLNSPFDGCIYNEDGELISIQNFDND